MRRVPPTLLPLVLTLLLPTAIAAEEGTDTNFPPGCPSDPTQCTYARASLEVGPLVVTIDAAVENGSAEEEAVVHVDGGDAGTLTFSLLANASSAGTTLNVTLRVNETTGLAWENGTTREIAYEPQAGFPRVETFRYRVAADAAPGPLPIPFTVTVGDASAFAYATLVVDAPEATARMPGLGAGLVALAALAVAVGWRTRGGER